MKFVIDTDLSTEGTMITIDGEKLSDTKKVASLAFYADAPNTKYNDDGYVALNVTSFDDEGNVKRESFSKRPEMAENVKPMGLQDNVEFEQSDVVRFLGDQENAEKFRLVDQIISYSISKKIACPSKDILITRSIESLQDKANDLGISSEDA